ncbi:nucleotide exchange factor GrpE [Hoeflea sp. YIM 152468]|uniref:nucleotide exchange factor GrpE n=1 Tax=Hoeflea sp. YIM 152468 TaxID=3031759 RepID=UPI0023DBC5EF|nr:nucleotide exchange factor GrpE [Hoeflea sp. YIM 152468]MDF1608331.1 nucleotide exchange factor GrpE [Hoeflea sp. YIM 152468]
MHTMSDESQGHEHENPTADAAPEIDQAADPASAPDPDPVEVLLAELAEMKDQRLRLAAEMENLRRRTAREIKDAKSFAVSGFARDMLQVSDNLQRALAAVPEQAEAAADNGLKSLVEGVELTERAMLSTLERHGVRKLDPMGQKFDPNFHQAMYEVPDPAVVNNTVVEVVQSGYVIGDRVLRPAMVGVAKGGPKEAAPQSDGPNPAAGYDT